LSIRFVVVALFLVNITHTALDLARVPKVRTLVGRLHAEL
jgi:hypothetical protein